LQTLHIPLGHGAEFDLIRRFLRAGSPAAGALPDSVKVGPGDDCAVVDGGGIALSVDMSIEDIHYRRSWLEPQEIGYRCVAAALSDLAAVAAAPIGVLIALAASDVDGPEVALAVMEGARAAASGYGAALLGGDVTRSPGPLVVDVVVVGETLRPALRRGAQPGDSLWVTGELGAAAAAVAAWIAGRRPEPAARLAFALPAPRIAEAAWLTGHNAVDAMVDISDGLAGDVSHIAAASSVHIVLDAASIPIHPTVHMGAADRADALRVALTGGEDYELCFAAPPGVVERIAESFTQTFNIPLTCVGTVHEGAGVSLRDVDGSVRDLALHGFNHFGRAPA
jgi:thiamine-monophosphate kinase